MAVLIIWPRLTFIWITLATLCVFSQHITIIEANTAVTANESCSYSVHKYCDDGNSNLLMLSVSENVISVKAEKDKTKLRNFNNKESEDIPADYNLREIAFDDYAFIGPFYCPCDCGECPNAILNEIFDDDDDDVGVDNDVTIQVYKQKRKKRSNGANKCLCVCGTCNKKSPPIIEAEYNYPSSFSDHEHSQQPADCYCTCPKPPGIVHTTTTSTSTTTTPKTSTSTSTTSTSTTTKSTTTTHKPQTHPTNPHTTNSTKPTYPTRPTYPHTTNTMKPTHPTYYPWTEATKHPYEHPQHPIDVRCPPTYDERIEIFYQNFDSCNEYFKCKHNYIEALECPPDKIWSTVEETCITNKKPLIHCLNNKKPPRINRPECRQTRSFVDSEEPSGSRHLLRGSVTVDKDIIKESDNADKNILQENRTGALRDHNRKFVASKDDCKHFIDCDKNSNMGVVHACPKRLRWNPAINRCDWAKNVWCS